MRRRAETVKKRRKLPEFKSDDEEAEFWSTHSPLDFQGEFKEVKNPFQLSPALAKKFEKGMKNGRGCEGRDIGNDKGVKTGKSLSA